MGLNHFSWGGGWGFPFIMPIFLLVVLFGVLRLVLGGGGFRIPWWDHSDRLPARDPEAGSALEVLKTRYAKGEITKDEFDRMKTDIQS